MAGPKKRADITIDFDGVESKGGLVPPGEYLIEVVSVEEKESSEGNVYLAWKWKVASGPHKGGTLYDNTSLKPTALWRLKGLLERMGIDASGKLGINFAELKGKTVMAEVIHETYQGKDKPRIANFLASEDPASSSSDPFKKGVKVTFEYEGETHEGSVVSTDGKNVVVLVDIDGNPEEWELGREDLTLAD